mmetsp:Transcript_19068/g.64920  ORF Transcript_19068/g.64920 Transcript_19068/m.64920 type:complete len:1396 (+) Transcript_19068:174-4361(+)
MAVFFANQVDLGAKVLPLRVAWSQVSGEQPLLAVALSGGGVGIYTEEGDALDKENPMIIRHPRSQDAERLAWHPSKRVVAVGWRDGTVTFWSEAERRASDERQMHSKAITCCVWSGEGDGARLLTGDEGGKVGVWKTDPRGRPVAVMHFQDSDTRVTHVVPKPTPKSGAPGEEPALGFFFATASLGRGSVFEADETGKKTHLYDVDTELSAVLHYKERGALVTISRHSMLSMHEPEGEGGEGPWKPSMSVKLPGMDGGGATFQACWTTPHVMACTSEKDTSVRMFNLVSEENFVLRARAGSGGTNRISSLTYNPKSETLAAGFKEGSMAMWRHVRRARGAGDEDDDPAESWDSFASVDVSGRVSHLCWGPNNRLLASLSGDKVHVLFRSVLQHKTRCGLAVCQVSSDKLMVHDLSASTAHLVDSPVQVSGVDMSETHMCVWNGRKASVYEMEGEAFASTSTFTTAASSIAVHRDSLYCTTGEPRVDICDPKGTVKGTLLFDEVQGAAAHVDVKGDYLAVATSKGVLRMWNLSRGETKQHGQGPGRRMELDGVPLVGVEQIRVNGTGSKVAILAAGADGMPDTRVVVYDVEADTFGSYSFAADARQPESCAWDEEDPRLLAVQARSVGSGGAELQVTTLFATPHDGVLLQEHHAGPANAEGLVGLSVPHVLLYTPPREDAAPGSVTPTVAFSCLRDFVGQEFVDVETRKALLNFSYHLSVGNMEEAYKSVKHIESTGVWENMSHLCIKTRRLDVADVCLGNMGHVRGVRAVREAAKEPEEEARVGVVAVQLGMVDEAKELFAKCERWDLLNDLHQACGEWEEALKVSERHDRIHMRRTHYLYARQLEAAGEFQAAVKEYEAAETHRVEVPRMLYEAGQTEDLEKYVTSSGDKELLKWWARYCESNGDLAKALTHYSAAEDWLSLVRVHCFREDYEAAMQLVVDSGDVAGAFHLARQFEAQDRVPEAVQYFTRAKRFSHAVRLAKQFGMDQELVNLALQADKRTMLDTALYLEEKGDADKAVMLFQKGGNTKRALELCFEAQLFEALRELADELGASSNADPALLARCADFFIENGQFAKAVSLLVTSGQHDRALTLALDNNVLITEEMAEQMTPPKGEVSEEERQVQLRRIAKCCKRQGSFHLACKKYTQAGDKLKAMQVLLKSGDTEKIIFFAGVSRQREIYMSAANYLQTLDWHNDAEIMKSIIQFYTKARAMDSLASFYEACAQIEIDEYRDYEKALGALREAQKYVQKARTEDKADRLQSLGARITYVERFVQACALKKTDPGEMVKLCSSLLEPEPEQQAEVEQAIRVGDVFAQLVEYWHKENNMSQAYQLIEKMRERGIILSPYLDQKMVSSVYQAMGVDPAEAAGMEPEGAMEDGVDEEIDEPVDDDED